MEDTYEQIVKRQVQAALDRAVQRFFDAEFLRLYHGDQSGGQPDGLLRSYAMNQDGLTIGAEHTVGEDESTI